MVVETMVLGLVTSALYDVLKAGVDRIPENHPLNRAIGATAKQFQGIEGVDLNLEKWLLSEESLRNIDEFIRGKDEVDLGSLSETLVSEVGFYCGEESTERATEVLKYFFEMALNESLKGDEGHPIISDRIDARTRQLSEQHKGTQEAMAEIDAKVTDTLRLVTRTIAIQEANEVLKERLSAEQRKILEEANLLLKEGQATAAGRLFERFIARQSQGDDTSKEVLFQAFTGLAQCQLELGNESEAISSLEDAHALLPDDEKSLSNMARAQVLKGLPEEGLRYIDRLLARNAESILGHCTKTETLAYLGRHGEAVSVLENKVKLLEDHRCCYSLGYAYLVARDYGKAETALRQAVEMSPKNFQYVVLLVTAIITPISQAPTLPWKMPDTVIERLKEAEGLLSEIIDALSGTERVLKHGVALTNRSAVRLLLNRPDDAIGDSHQAIEIDDSNSTAYRNLGIAQIVTGEFDSSIDTLILAIEKGEPAVDLVPKIMRACLFRDEPDPAQALAVAAKYCADQVGRDLELTLASSDAHIALGDNDQALKLLQGLKKDHASNARVLLGFARYESAAGKESESESHLLEAYRIAEGYDKSEAAGTLAKHYFKRDLYDRAIAYYEEVINPAVNNGVLKDYLICLYRSTTKQGAHGVCLQICESLRKVQGVLEVISEIEARIHEELGNLKVASKLYSELGEIAEDGYEHTVRCAILEFRMGNEDTAVTILDKVKDKIPDDAYALMSVAQVLGRVGRRAEAIPTAYRALQLAPSDPDMHLAYIQFFLSRDDKTDKLLRPQVVEIDTVVVLNIDDEKRILTVFDRPDADMSKGEISTTSELGRGLLGSKVGDRLVVGRPPSQEKVEVLSIASKYAKAFGESLTNFNRLFDDERLLKVRVSENLKEVFEVTEEISKRAKNLIGLYRHENLPVCVFARLLGRNIVEIWEGLRSDPDMTVKCANGSVAEQQAEAEMLSSAKGIIVDLSGLLTLAYTCCFVVATSMFDRVFVSQSSLDEIGSIIGELGRDERARLHKDEETGKYILLETKPEEIAERSKFVESIKDFVSSECEVLGLDEPPSDAEQSLREMIGESFADTVIAARQKGLVLYSDDRSLRYLVRKEFGVEGFGIQSFLTEALRRGAIDEGTCNEKIIQLATGGYHYISVSGEVLSFCVRQADFEVTPTVLRLVQILEAPETTVVSAAGALSEFVRLLWMESITGSRKRVFLDLCLEVLTKNRGIRATVPIFKHLLSIKMRLLQLHLDEVMSGIDTWVRGHVHMI